jgi:hypothetical protein
MYVNGKHVQRDGATPMIPMIDEHWPVTDLPTIASCDAAEIILRDAIGRIEQQMAEAAARGEATGRGDVHGSWLHRTRTALKFKRSALCIVHETRAKLLFDRRNASASA